MILPNYKNDFHINIVNNRIEDKIFYLKKREIRAYKTFIFAPSNGTNMIEIGTTVKVHYTGKFLDDTVFDSTANSGPIIFTVGDEMMIPGFEKAILDMEVGNTKSITLKPEDAYGIYDPNLIFVVKKDEYFENKDIKIGDQIQIPTEDDVAVFVVISLEDDIVKLDGNSEMAGKEVKFDIELLEIVSSSNPYTEEFEDSFEEEMGEDWNDEYLDLDEISDFT